MAERLFWSRNIRPMLNTGAEHRNKLCAYGFPVYTKHYAQQVTAITYF
jgi:hypothetical protein